MDYVGGALGILVALLLAYWFGKRDEEEKEEAKKRERFEVIVQEVADSQ